MTKFTAAPAKYDGIIEGLPEAEYHSADGLSSTGAKKLLRSPAHFQHFLNHPQEPRDAFDMGHAVHSKVLGVGAQIAVIPDEVLAVNGATSTKAAREFIDNARTEGLIPVKKVVANVVNLMAESVLQHPIARDVLEQAGARAELSVFARDPELDINIRCRFDIIGDMVAGDLKTTSGEASPDAFARTAVSFGYDLSQEHYLHTWELVTGERPRFLFLVVENTAPYLASVNVLDDAFVEIGRAKARRARELYARSMETGRWPGYPATIGVVAPPVFAIYEHQDRMEREAA